MTDPMASKTRYQVVCQVIFSIQKKRKRIGFRSRVQSYESLSILLISMVSQSPMHYTPQIHVSMNMASLIMLSSTFFPLLQHRLAQLDTTLHYPPNHPTALLYAVAKFNGPLHTRIFFPQTINTITIENAAARIPACTPKLFLGPALFAHRTWK